MSRYSSIKEEKLLKVWCASDLEISSTFWENTGPFPLGKVTQFFVGREEIINSYKPTK